MSQDRNAQPASLRQDEAVERRALLDVLAYDVSLDLASDERTFGSVTRIRFTSGRGSTFVDLQPESVRSIHLDGTPVPADLLRAGRLPLELGEGEHELVVDAVMRFRNDGEGLHRSVDPADGRHYVYAMCFLAAAPSVFACFDQPDLKAPYAMHVRAPEDWWVTGNTPATQVEPGVWELERSEPLSTYFVTVVAGPYHVVTDRHDGLDLGISARASMAAALEADAEDILTVTKQSFDELHRLFGVRYPFGRHYHQAFVPEFTAGAMENPGCITLRDHYVATSRMTRSDLVVRAVTIAHEMAHQWFGDLVTPRWWDDLWLNESFAEYMGNRVAADATEYSDAWIFDAYTRRQWGLQSDASPSTHPVAGNGAADALTALQDFDGISYAKGSAVLKQLSARLGDDVFFRGVSDHFARHRYGNATMDDLFAAWEGAGAGDLGGFVQGWLRTAGVDLIELDRPAGVLRRRVPADHPADRVHTFRVATGADGTWQDQTVTVDRDEVPYAVSAGAVLLDPYEDTWAEVQPDAETVRAVVDLLPHTDDDLLRAGVWNNVRTAHRNAAIDSTGVLDVLEAAMASERNELAAEVLPWAARVVAPLARDPRAAMERVHAAARGLLEASEPGSLLQLGAFRGAVVSATDAGVLAAWSAGDGLPEGVTLDVDLRWRVLVRRAALGLVSRDELDAALAAEPTDIAHDQHVRAWASLPDAEAKAWAWARFTGEADASNYELESAGLGMWQPGQEDVTAPYVARYFEELPGTVEVRKGGMLADAGYFYFPTSSVTAETVALAQELVERPGLDASLRRIVVDAADVLRRRLAVKELG